MSIVLIVIYTLASGATNTVAHPVTSFQECYQRGTQIVVNAPKDSVTYKCRITWGEEET